MVLFLNNMQKNILLSKMIKNYMEKNHEFITVKCDIIFTTMIDLKNNTEHLKSSINNNNIGDRILINKVERKIEKINPLLNKSLNEFKYSFSGG